MYKVGFKGPEEPEIKLPAFVGSWRKQGSSRRNIYFCFIEHAKVFDSVDHNKLETSKIDGNTKPSYLSPVCGSRSNRTELK